MAETVSPGDYIALAAYFVVVLGVGIWASFRRGKDNTEGYFLAGKHMTWIPVGASIFASNVGAPMFIGLAGAGAASGYSVVVYEWSAVFLLIALGWFFLPVYVSSGALTIPEYLKKRFGGQRLRISLSVLALVLYILTKISTVIRAVLLVVNTGTLLICVEIKWYQPEDTENNKDPYIFIPWIQRSEVEIYCGALFMQLLLGWNLYICICSILVVTALYTVIGWYVAGGLVAVMYTDTLQTVILLIGACVLTVKGFQEIGDLQGLADKFVTAVSNTTLINTTYHSCGLPPENSMHIWRDAVTGDIPWPGALIGLPTIGLWVWCSDQLMVQRTLSAKNMTHAKGGTLLAASLKILPFFLWIMPGMISRIYYPDEVACSSPSECYEVCRNEAGCSNIAYPLLVLRVLPEGGRGIMLAALLAALMSSLTSIFNSASSMFTMDIWPYIRKNSSNSELMIVGRIAVLVCTGIGIVWLPVMQQAQGGQLWGYLQAISAYTAPPWTVLFLVATLWKRATEQGAFWGLFSGLAIGCVRLCLDFVYSAPFCGSGEKDTRPAVLKDVHFLYFAIILSLITLLIIVGISLCTEPRPDQELNTTWWTRHNNDENMNESEMVEETGEEEYQDHCPHFEEDKEIKQNKGTCLKIARWLCGITQMKSATLSKEERLEIQKNFTSLEEKACAKTSLNICATGLLLLTCFLFGYFA